MRKYLLIGLMFFSFVSSGTAGINKDLVPDEATAVKVASVILEKYMGKKCFEARVRKAPLRAELEGEIWTVFSYPRSPPSIQNAESVDVLAGGGAPVIELSKKDARVLDIYYSR